jgi:UDP-glucose 4-epimerase
MQKKNILVTGGAGFVGSNLCRRLVSQGHAVISLDNYFTGSRDASVSGIEYREGHTKDVETLVPEKIDLVYHLGEYARVEQSLQEPDVVWDLNVAGTHGVLEFWRTRNRSGQTMKLVYAGSSTKFGDGGLARVATPYAWTKAANTELVKNYAAWYGLPFAITYFYNVYGPGERSGKYGTLIEIFRQKYLRGEPLTVVAPGTQKRNFTHVNDIVGGLVLVGEKGQGEEYGLGDERKYSILEIAQMFNTKVEMLPERAGNRLESAINTERSKALGWQVEHSVADYIADIIRTRT